MYSLSYFTIFQSSSAEGSSLVPSALSIVRSAIPKEPSTITTPNQEVGLHRSSRPAASQSEASVRRRQRLSMHLACIHCASIERSEYDKLISQFLPYQRRSPFQRRSSFTFTSMNKAYSDFSRTKQISKSWRRIGTQT
jgi:hypothetical protein